MVEATCVQDLMVPISELCLVIFIHNTIIKGLPRRQDIKYTMRSIFLGVGKISSM